MAKSKPISVLFGILTMVVVLAIAPSAFADSSEVDIAKGAGASANAACVSTNNCFNPSPVTVAPGTEVEWKNTDTVGHTVTSGKPTDNDAGSLFDSGIVKAGNDFKFTFQNPGTFDYFCQVHPWMVGQVIVSASSPSSSSGTMSSMPTQQTTSTTPNTSSNQTATPVVTVNNVTATVTSSPSNEATSNTQQPSEVSSAPSTPAPSTTESTSSSYAASQSNPTPSMSSDQMTGWGIGIAVIAIMSGIGVWSAARRR